MQTRKRSAPLETNPSRELEGTASSTKVARRDVDASTDTAACTTQDTFHPRLQAASAVCLRDNRSLHLLQILRNLTPDSPVDVLQKQWVTVLRTIQAAAREPMFGLNMSWSDESSNILFFKFMQLYYYFLPNEEEPAELATKRASLLTAFVACYHAHESEFLSTFTPTLRGPNHTTIIHCTIEHLTLSCDVSFMRDFVRSMIRHGVPADAQNAEGKSYLHEQVRGGSILAIDRVLALGFLHECGVPFNLQRDNGNTMLHDLVFYRRLVDLQAVCAHRDSYHLDYWVENKAGQTPIELAQFLHDLDEEEEEDHEFRMEILETLRLNASLWKEHIQPIICEAIRMSTSLIPDVAHIVANYLA
jgi:hypothetical protein